MAADVVVRRNALATTVNARTATVNCKTAVFASEQPLRIKERLFFSCFATTCVAKVVRSKSGIGDLASTKPRSCERGKSPWRLVGYFAEI
jgi:hypothetical protein